MDYDAPERGIRQGIQSNAWNRPTAYLIYYTNPTDFGFSAALANMERALKSVPAVNMLHLAYSTRLGQTRGRSIFAPGFLRMDDLKDYEESERAAARVASAMGVAIMKGDASTYSGDADAAGNRYFNWQPGQIWDGLLPGEEPKVIESNRPSALLAPFREAMLRAFCSSTRASYSSTSRNYDGTYSSQRQEMNENKVHYNVLAEKLVSRITQPIYENWVRMAILSNTIRVPANIDRNTLTLAEYTPQAMPWIDPQKEARGEELLIRAGVKSRAKAIRERGRAPSMVRKEIDAEREADKEQGLVFSSNSAHDTNPAFAVDGDDDDEAEEQRSTQQRGTE
jgi:lambda family phage portal protein